MKALEDEQGTNLVIQGVHKNMHKLDKYCLKFHLRNILKDTTIDIFLVIREIDIRTTLIFRISCPMNNICTHYIKAYTYVEQ